MAQAAVETASTVEPVLSTSPGRDPARDVPMIEVQDLAKTYGTFKALNGVSFKVHRGEVVGFLGPNGAGKSTTMKLLTGYLKPTGGVAKIAGHDVSEASMKARQSIGYLPESAPLYDDMMVLEFLEFIADLRGLPKATRQARLYEVCRRCGLLNVLGKDIGQLSKGYRQRVGLAQAIVHDPDLLILDEPTSGLDPNQIIEIRELIRDLGREKTILLSTHILPEVQATCGRIIIISDGRLVADATPDALTESDAGAMIQLVVKPKAHADRQAIQSKLSALPGVSTVEAHDGEGSGTFGFRIRTRGDADPREAIFDASVANQWAILNLNRERVSLEDTFRRLTRKEDSGVRS